MTPTAKFPPSTPLDLLRRVFGYPEFRGRQAEVIERAMNGGDALVLMPTGGGKSLCYQIPALLRRGVGVVVSPLIALMHDQVMALQQVGVRAAYLNSSLSGAEAATVERALLQGELDLLYVAPERLLTPRFLALLDELVAGAGVALFAIDEAHCVSQWGHDFRPEYIQLSILHERYPGVPRLALTATADAATRAEIVQRLQLEAAGIYVSSFDRPNIRYRIVDKHAAREQLLAFIDEEHRGEAGIVYCLSRRKVEETAAWLQSRGVTAIPYHAGLDAALRRTHQDRFLREDGVVVCATIAFGMGIDKPDVRFVAHLDLPKSIEGYYQETGRAGRDGAAADAWMAYGLGDAVQQRRMIDESEADEAYKRLSHAKLNALLGLCEAASCRRQRLLAYFGEDSAPCGNCDVCLDPPQTWDATEAARKALSCVYRTEQRFGAGHLIDVLLGRDTERIRSWRHHQVSTYGIGKELSEDDWRSVFRQLMTMGLMEVDHAAHGALKLTTAARAVLRGEQTVQLRRATKKLTKAQRRAEVRAARPAIAVADLDTTQRALFDYLRGWRAETARELGVPAYVVFNDMTLASIAQVLPGDMQALGRISGMGSKKLDDYGARLLEFCIRFADEHGLTPNCGVGSGDVKPHVARAWPELNETASQTLTLLRQGLTVAEIAELRSLKPTTIESHCADAIAAGYLQLDEVLSLDAAELSEIEAAINLHSEDGAPKLKLVYDLFEGRYDYGKLRCVAAAGRM